MVGQGTVKPRKHYVKSILAGEAMPEHEKMAPHVDVHWGIRDFLAFLAARDIQLAYLTGSVCKSIGPQAVEHLLMRFRGVDPDAYQAESDRLMATYGDLIARRTSVPDGTGHEQLALIDEDADQTIIKIIQVLDGIQVPVWAGRPSCAQAMRDNDLSVPKTALLARAVKFRKSLYGIVEGVPGQFTPDDPRNRHNRSKTSRGPVDDEQAVQSLMAKLKGDGDAAQD